MARSEWSSERERKRRPACLPQVGGLPESVRLAGRWWIRFWALALALTAAAGVAGASTASSAAPPAQSVRNALPALHVSLWSKAGATVTAVKFTGVAFPAGDEIFSQLQQKAGQPLDPGKVRADERRLFATGMYVDLSVDLIASGSGVILVYAGQPRYFVGRVTVAGVDNSRLASLLEFSTRLDPGAPFSDGALATAVEAVKEALAENGFFVPAVTMRTSVDPVANQVNVTFTVITGP
ncbi:MAG: POTRA domain-containing protein, partial [Acidobacteriota bacterium]